MKSPRPARRKLSAPAEVRLQHAYIHLTSRRHSTSTLAAALGVSPATALRLVKALRRRGHRIVSVREKSKRFFAVRWEDDQALERDPLIRARGTIRVRR